MIYPIALGTGDDAAIVEHDATAGTLSIGDEIRIDGVMWMIYQLAPTDRNADFITALAAPSVFLTLDTVNVELYRSELARLRREVARLVDTRGEPAAEALAMVEGVLERNEAPETLSDDALRILSHALHAIEVSEELDDRLRAFWHELRDYLARRDG